jgi:hypothetical protein
VKPHFLWQHQIQFFCVSIKCHGGAHEALSDIRGPGVGNKTGCGKLLGRLAFRVAFRAYCSKYQGYTTRDTIESNPGLHPVPVLENFSFLVLQNQDYTQYQYWRTCTDSSPPHPRLTFGPFFSKLLVTLLAVLSVSHSPHLPLFARHLSARLKASLRFWVGAPITHNQYTPPYAHHTQTIHNTLQS